MTDYNIRELRIYLDGYNQALIDMKEKFDKQIEFCNPSKEVEK